MTRISKDSREVSQFREHFARLRDWMDDDPGDLKQAAEQDQSIDELCGRLHLTAYLLEEAQDTHPRLFSAPADPKFIAEWRDYERR